ncbi:hypothetical protein EBU95_16490, partial [bacterium]|nr:hypothetical protein [bacterium]
MNALVGLSNNIKNNFNKVKVWANSFKENCSGNVYLLCANSSQEEIDLAKSLNINVISVTVEDTWYINHKRLYHIHNFLKTAIEENFIITDVFDVIFQADPFKKFDSGNEIFLGQEGVKVSEEPWNADNINKLFPEEFKNCLNTEVVCSGIIGGKKQALLKLYEKMYDLCERSTNNHNIKDQAALIVMLSRNEIPLLKLFTLNDAFAVHCAVAGPTKFFEGWGFKNSLIKKGLHIPYLENGKVKTNGVVFDIVHQFNRIPEW